MNNRTSPTRSRRTKQELGLVLDAVRQVSEEEQEPMTIRHLFYRIVGLGLIEKTERAYKNLCELVSGWRREGEIPWSAFIDSTRWRLGSRSFDTMEQALLNTVATYRKNLWSRSKSYIEVWVEKDAIAGILLSEADVFGVPVLPCRGFPSLSCLYRASEDFIAARNKGKELRVFYFGDHDPSGVYIDKKAEACLAEDFDVDVPFERIAVTLPQIKQYNLPTRPTKETDTRAASFEGEGVEIDTMPPSVLRQLVRGCIERHIDTHELSKLKQAEKLERESLACALTKLPAGSDPFALAEMIRNMGDEFGLV